VETGAVVQPVEINVTEAGNITMTMATPKFECAVTVLSGVIKF